MSSPLGAFYVFLQCDGRLYLGIFPSRAHADKYWRIISRIRTGGPSRRYHSQYYVVSVLPDSILDYPNWDKKMCLVRLVKEECSLPVIPPDQHPDNRNGASFYIRSTIHPKFYWYFNRTNRQVELSKTHQTKFTITRISTPPQFSTSPSRNEEDILIGEDMIALSVGYNGQRVNIVRGPENTMIPDNQPGPFQFSVFEKGFYGLYGKADGLVCTSNTDGDEVGERWEFVA